MAKKKRPKWDALIEETKDRYVRCHSCNDEARGSIAELMAVLHEKNARKVGVRQMYEIICKAEPGFPERVKYDSFRTHISHHEPLWLRAKGK